MKRRHMDGGQSMAKRGWLLPCCAPHTPTLASATPSAIQPTQENVSTAPHVVQVTRTDDDEVSLSKAWVPHA